MASLLKQNTGFWCELAFTFRNSHIVLKALSTFLFLLELCVRTHKTTLLLNICSEKYSCFIANHIGLHSVLSVVCPVSSG